MLVLFATGLGTFWNNSISCVSIATVAIAPTTLTPSLAKTSSPRSHRLTFKAVVAFSDLSKRTMLKYSPFSIPSLLEVVSSSPQIARPVWPSCSGLHATEATILFLVSYTAISSPISGEVSQAEPKISKVWLTPVFTGRAKRSVFIVFFW